MQMLGEVYVSDVAIEVNRVVSFGQVPIRGLSVHMQQNTVDELIISSGPTATEQVEFSGRIPASSANEFTFGGPVAGPFVRIDWQGNADQKRAVFRFWDEPLRAFGLVPFGRQVTAGVAAGGFTPMLNPNELGSWANGVFAMCYSAGPMAAYQTVGIGGLLSTVRTTVGSTGAGLVGILPLFWPRGQIGFELENTAAGAQTCSVELWAVLGR